MRTSTFIIRFTTLFCLFVSGSVFTGCSEKPTAGPDANSQTEQGEVDPGPAPGNQSEPTGDGGPILLPPTSAPE